MSQGGALKTTTASAVPDWTSLNLIGASPAFLASLDLLAQCARVDATVLLCGETGTGKELAARAVHYLSDRGRGPFVPVNCAAIPDSILEAELFGNARGAFTDARTERPGVVCLARRGTLFLDEVDSLTPRAQSTLLRFLQDHVYRPLGAARFEQADVRVVAATNVDLEAQCARGLFRSDLMYRINVLSVSLPPLRQRPGDALLLARTFTHRLVTQYGTAPRQLSSASAEQLLQDRPWPGNVRELEHRVHRAFLLAQGDELDLGLDQTRDARAHPGPGSGATFAAAKAQAIAAFERQYLIEVLGRANGNLSQAARLAGKERSRFGKLVRKHRLQAATAR